MHTTDRFRIFALVLSLAGILCIASAAGMAKLVIDSPKDGEAIQQTPGLGPVAIIKFHAENFKIESLAGHDAMHHDGAMTGMGENSGHLHVTVDDNSWYWVHSNSDPVVIAGLSTGPHKVTLELVGAGHKPLNPPAKQVLNFTMAGQ